MREEIGEKQFYLTPAHECSYLERRTANTLFLDPRDTHSSSTYLNLTRLGFRRSGGHLYRPHCRACNACVPTRIPVDGFVPNRRFRRVLRTNADIEIRIEPAVDDRATYALYDRYISLRHRDGDMYPPSIDQFRSFLFASWSETRFVSSYLDDRLVAIAVTDVLEEGLSAIYTFFEPDLVSRSLGVFSILQQIELCRRIGAPYLYLGYWIKESPKMRYKADYKPIEVYTDGRWITLE